ncbi:hypothetical protein E3P99_03318, partial [Wallemia hederae]
CVVHVQLQIDISLARFELYDSGHDRIYSLFGDGGIGTRSEKTVRVQSLTVTTTTYNRMRGLFKAIAMGEHQLRHRVAMAPLTRLRVDEQGVPAPYTPLYYSQRASDGGLIITEATLPAEEAGGLPNLPGIFSSSQIQRWRQVVKGVHAKKGVIFCQLYALGRVASPHLVTVRGMLDDVYDGNRVTKLSESDIQRYIAHFATAAGNAVDGAGFDGVEIHAANGYLLDQAIQLSHLRSDAYGGANHLQFPIEVVDQTQHAIGERKTGVRISPFSRYQGMRNSSASDHPYALFEPFVRHLVTCFPRLAYVHFVEGYTEEDVRMGDELKRQIKAAGIPVISNLCYNLDVAHSRALHHDEIVAFGKDFVSNPDLPKRIEMGWPLNEPDVSAYYTGGEKGYIDYPFYEPQ